ncbi:MAG: precorrin-6y C5,15-methyltransferase (decarboxylating) subunit CbiE [Chloroflexota bacterium]
MPPNVTVIGITDAGASSLSAEAHELVEAAALLCGGERHLDFFPRHPAERVMIKSDIDGLVERLRQEQRPAVVLASGDPMWFGIGSILAEQLGLDRVRVLPNLSALQLACARLGIPWQQAVSLSAHGRPLSGILPQALLAQTVAILTDECNPPSAVAQALLRAGDEDACADVFEHLGGSEERHIAARLSELVDQKFAALNLLVVRHDRPPRRWPLGLPEEAFAHHAGLITKAEVRAVTLSKLRLHERSTVWDVGAGCGSVAIEAAALARHGRVYAAERDQDQLRFMAENLERFGAGNVTTIAGTAPAALDGLPPPDAVFIGGSGGQLAAIATKAMDSMRPNGTLVANFVALEHLAEFQRLLQQRDWEADITQVSAARSNLTAGVTRLAAQNPVFIVAAQAAGL